MFVHRNDDIRVILKGLKIIAITRFKGKHYPGKEMFEDYSKEAI